MPSFDIVSEVKLEEIRNATENTLREIATRFDFRGVDASVVDNQVRWHAILTTAGGDSRS